MSTPDPNCTDSLFLEDGAPSDSTSCARDIGSDSEVDGDCGDIIASMQSIQISTPPSFNSGLIPTPAEFSPGNASHQTVLSPGDLPDLLDFGIDYSPPLVESSPMSWSSFSIDIPARPPAPTSYTVDPSSSGESGYLNQIELYPDSSTESPAEFPRKALWLIDLPLDDSNDDFTNNSAERSGEALEFHAHVNPHAQLPDTDDEHHFDRSSCPNCRMVGEGFRDFLLAPNELGAALAFDEEDAEVIEEAVTEIYALEAEAVYKPGRVIAIPHTISMFSFDVNLFLPLPPDRSGEFLALGADPGQVEIWAEDYFEDVDDLRRGWEGEYATSVRNLELESAPHGEELRSACDTLRNFIEMRFVAEANDRVEEDLEKCRRGEWFLRRPPSGTSRHN